MTFWHVVNVVFPVVAMVGFGYFLDHVSKPNKPAEESQD